MIYMEHELLVTYPVAVFWHTLLFVASGTKFCLRGMVTILCVQEM